VSFFLFGRSIFVPICNRLHGRRANSGKIRTFKWGYPDLRSRSRENLSLGHEVLHKKQESLGAAQGEDFVILACVVLTQYRSVTGGRTNGQTPQQWLRPVGRA